MWTKCNACRRIVYKQDIIDNLYVCPHCGFHYRLSARKRIELLLDNGEYKELFNNIYSDDPLHFVDNKPYTQRLKESKERSGEDEAVVVVEGKLDGIPVILAVMEYYFIGGSMGSVVGEKITRAVEKALADRKPLIIVSSSGGARMMEGVLSLMQMAKVSAALARLDEAGIPYISVLTDPTTGGVTASYAMLGDINIAEPKALIGFAGPRVIEQTIRQKLPEGFQRSEFLLEHGMIDEVVHRTELKNYIARALRLFLNRPKE